MGQLQAPVSPSIYPHNPARFSMPTLLVVDDEPGVRYSFGRVFGEEGIEVLTAATVAEGKKQFDAHQPDVVVLDLKLPDGSGLEVFEKIRSINPKHPVIFI